MSVDAPVYTISAQGLRQYKRFKQHREDINMGLFNDLAQSFLLQPTMVKMRKNKNQMLVRTYV